MGHGHNQSPASYGRTFAIGVRFVHTGNYYRYGAKQCVTTPCLPKPQTSCMTNSVVNTPRYRWNLATPHSHVAATSCDSRLPSRLKVKTTTSSGNLDESSRREDRPDP